MRLGHIKQWRVWDAFEIFGNMYKISEAAPVKHISPVWELILSNLIRV